MTDQPKAIRPERGDSIHIGGLSPLAFAELRDLAETAGWPEVRAWMDPAEVLLLIERLKHVRDDEDIFPTGKWATIQRLQELFEQGFWGNSNERS